MAELVEADIAEERAGHGKDEGRIEEDETSLADVGVVYPLVSNCLQAPPSDGQHTKQNQSGGNQARGKTVPAFPHSQEHHRNRERAHKCRHSSEGYVGHLVVDIRVANVVELEVAIIAHEPAHKGEQKLAERRVDIEKVCPLQILDTTP